VKERVIQALREIELLFTELYIHTYTHSRKTTKKNAHSLSHTKRRHDFTSVDVR